MKKNFLMLLLGALFVGACPVVLADDTGYSNAYNSDSFILASNGHSHISIGVDTTNPELLKLGIALQNTVYALSGARPPIEHVGVASLASKSDQWRMIYFVQDMRSMGAQPLYTVSMEHHQPGYSINCGKRIKIAYFTVDQAQEAINDLLEQNFQTGLIDKAPKEEVRKRLLSITTNRPKQSQGVVVQQLKKKERKTLQQQKNAPDKK